MDIGHQKSPKSFAALKAELHQRIAEMEELCGEKQRLDGIDEAIQRYEEEAEAAKKLAQEEQAEFIRNTDLYKGLEAAGYYVEVTNDGVLVANPSIILKSNFL